MSDLIWNGRTHGEAVNNSKLTRGTTMKAHTWLHRDASCIVLHPRESRGWDPEEVPDVKSISKSGETPGSSSEGRCHLAEFRHWQLVLDP